MKKIASGFAIFSAVVIVSVPLIASAADFDATCIAEGGCWGPLITCDGDYANVNHPGRTPKQTAEQTCQSVCNITVLIQTWIFFFYTIILYVLLPLGVAIGGFLWLTSAGNEQRVTSAREWFGRTFKWFLVATVIVAVMGFVIANIGIGASNQSAKTPLTMSITCNRTDNPLDVNLQTPGQ